MSDSPQPGPTQASVNHHHHRHHWCIMRAATVNAALTHMHASLRGLCVGFRDVGIVGLALHADRSLRAYILPVSVPGLAGWLPLLLP